MYFPVLPVLKNLVNIRFETIRESKFQRKLFPATKSSFIKVNPLSPLRTKTDVVVYHCVTPFLSVSQVSQDFYRSTVTFNFKRFFHLSIFHQAECAPGGTLGECVTELFCCLTEFCTNRNKNTYTT